MKTKLEVTVLALAVAGLVALPAAGPRTAAAADESYGSRAADAAKSAGETTKNAAENAGSAVKSGAEKTGSAIKNGAEGAAGYVSDAAKNATTRLEGKDALFVRKTAIGDLFEMKSAELAKDKASSEDVKSFAEHMIQDHTKANEELEKLAKQKDFTVPTQLDNQHQAMLDKLSGLSGEAFDREYLKQQRMGHQAMLKLMQDEAKNGKDADLKNFAEKTKDTVSQHHARIQKLEKGQSRRTASAKS